MTSTREDVRVAGLTFRLIASVLTAFLLLPAAVTWQPAAASAASATSVHRHVVGGIPAGSWTRISVRLDSGVIAQATAGGMRVAAPGFACTVAITDSYYSRTATGTRSLVVTLVNTDLWECDTTLYVAEFTADRSRIFYELAPGGIWEMAYNAALNSRVHMAGVTPDVPATGTCRLRIETISRATPAGELHFFWRIRNIGTAACAGEYHFGTLPIAQERDLRGQTYKPGTGATPFGGAQSPYRVFVVGYQPASTSAGDCDFSTVQTFGTGDVAQYPNPNLEYEFRNVGKVTCSLTKATIAFVP